MVPTSILPGEDAQPARQGATASYLTLARVAPGPSSAATLHIFGQPNCALAANAWQYQ